MNGETMKVVIGSGRIVKNKFGGKIKAKRLEQQREG